MVQTKKEEDWSDEEKKLVAEYERKVKELNEEREKYRKVMFPMDTEMYHRLVVLDTLQYAEYSRLSCYFQIDYTQMQLPKIS